MKKAYMIVETLNGNLVLKPSEKVKETEYVEIELYADSLEDAKLQFKQHKQELKEAGLL